MSLKNQSCVIPFVQNSETSKTNPNKRRSLLAAYGEAGAGGEGLSVTKGPSGVTSVLYPNLLSVTWTKRAVKFPHQQVSEWELLLSEVHLKKPHTGTLVIIERNTHRERGGPREMTHRG